MSKNLKILLLGTAALLCAAGRLPAQDGLEVSVKGFVDTYHAVRTAAPGDWMSSRTRARGGAPPGEAGRRRLPVREPGL